jgi:hypothetical protein
MDLVFNSERFITNPHNNEMAGTCDLWNGADQKEKSMHDAKFEK